MIDYYRVGERGKCEKLKIPRLYRSFRNCIYLRLVRGTIFTFYVMRSQFPE